MSKFGIYSHVMEVREVLEKGACNEEWLKLQVSALCQMLVDVEDQAESWKRSAAFMYVLAHCGDQDALLDFGKDLFSPEYFSEE